MAQSRLEARHRPTPPACQMRHDVLDRPPTGNVWLRHVRFANIAQELLPLGIFSIQIIEQVRFAHTRAHRILQMMLSSAFRSAILYAWRARNLTIDFDSE